MMPCRVVESGEVVIVLVELGLVEQRYQAVLEVLNDASTVTDVAIRFRVTRQTVHRWLRKYAADGIAGLVEHVSTPGSCPHQMSPVVEARIVELRRLNPGWGPRTIRFRFEAERVDPLPGRSSVYRCLPSRSDRAGGAASEEGGLQAVGTLEGDGVVADGCCRWAQWPISWSPGVTRPLSYAKTTACARSRRPSLVKMFETWLFTVAAPM